MNKDKRSYSVKCLICGEDICDCYGESHISIKCAICKTRFIIVRNNSLMIEEKKMAL